MGDILLAIKFGVPAILALFITRFYMDRKQQYILTLYFAYCLINNYAVAAVMLPQHTNTLSPEAFILGLSGAVLACSWLQKIDNSPKTYSSLILSMLLAGFGSHALSKGFIDWCQCLDMESLYYFTPLIIGVAVPTLVPVGINFLVTKLGGNEKKEDKNV